MANSKKPEIGDTVLVRQLGQTEIKEGKVTALHDGDHITCEIKGPHGKEIESVGFNKGHSVDASWDWV